MIGKLKGKVDEIDEDSAIIDVGGVGYHVFCSGKTLSNLAIGDAAMLIIETHVREDHIHLLGFANKNERDWFRLLTTVQGVGVKMALAVLGIFDAASLANIIAAKDTKSLTRVSGVGAKLAERIVTELKNKIAKLPTSELKISGGKTNSALPPASINEDAISALVNLGFNRVDAYNAVSLASVSLDDAITIDNLISESLKKLAR